MIKLKSMLVFLLLLFSLPTAGYAMESKQTSGKIPSKSIIQQQDLPRTITFARLPSKEDENFLKGLSREFTKEMITKIRDKIMWSLPELGTPYTCPSCRCTLLNNFKQHIDKYHIKRFKCSSCDFTDSTERNGARYSCLNKTTGNHEMQKYILDYTEIVDLSDKFRIDLNVIINEIQPANRNQHPRVISGSPAIHPPTQKAQMGNSANLPFLLNSEKPSPNTLQEPPKSTSTAPHETSQPLTPTERTLVSLLDQMSPTDIENFIMSKKNEIKRLAKPTDQGLICNACNKAFPESNFSTHINKTHIKIFICQYYCGLAVNYQSEAIAAERRACKKNYPYRHKMINQTSKGLLDFLKAFNFDLNSIINEIKSSHSFPIAATAQQLPEHQEICPQSSTISKPSADILIPPQTIIHQHHEQPLEGPPAIHSQDQKAKDILVTENKASISFLLAEPSSPQYIPENTSSVLFEFSSDEREKKADAELHNQNKIQQALENTSVSPVESSSNEHDLTEEQLFHKELLRRIMSPTEYNTLHEISPIPLNEVRIPNQRSEPTNLFYIAASWLPKIDIIDYLKSHGVDINFKMPGGLTPLDILTRVQNCVPKTMLEQVRLFRERLIANGALTFDKLQERDNQNRPTQPNTAIVEKDTSQENNATSDAHDSPPSPSAVINLLSPNTTNEKIQPKGLDVANNGNQAETEILESQGEQKKPERRSISSRRKRKRNVYENPGQDHSVEGLQENEIQRETSENRSVSPIESSPPLTQTERQLVSLLDQMSYQDIKNFITKKMHIKTTYIKPFRCQKNCGLRCNNQSEANRAEQNGCKNNPPYQHMMVKNMPQALVDCIKEFNLDINSIINQINSMESDSNVPPLDRDKNSIHTTIQQAPKNNSVSLNKFSIPPSEVISLLPPDQTQENEIQRETSENRSTSPIDMSQPLTQTELTLVSLLEKMSTSDTNKLIKRLYTKIKEEHLTRDAEGLYICCNSHFDSELVSHFITVHIKPLRCQHCPLQCSQSNESKAKQRGCKNNPPYKHTIVKNMPQALVDCIKEFNLDTNYFINQIQQQNQPPTPTTPPTPPTPEEQTLLALLEKMSSSKDFIKRLYTKIKEEHLTRDAEELYICCNSHFDDSKLVSHFRNVHIKPLRCQHCPRQCSQSDANSVKQTRCKNNPPYKHTMIENMPQALVDCIKEFNLDINYFINQIQSINSSSNLSAISATPPHSNKLSTKPSTSYQVMPSYMIMPQVAISSSGSSTNSSNSESTTTSVSSVQLPESANSELSQFSEEATAEQHPDIHPANSIEETQTAESNVENNSELAETATYEANKQQEISRKRKRVDSSSQLSPTEQQLLSLLEKMSPPYIKELITNLKTQIKESLTRNADRLYICCKKRPFNNDQLRDHINRAHFKSIRCQKCSLKTCKSSAKRAEQSKCHSNNNLPHIIIEDLPNAILDLIRDFKKQLDINVIINQIRQETQGNDNLEVEEHGDTLNEIAAELPENNETQPMGIDDFPEITQNNDDLAALFEDEALNELFNEINPEHEFLENDQVQPMETEKEQEQDYWKSLAQEEDEVWWQKFLTND